MKPKYHKPRNRDLTGISCIILSLLTATSNLFIAIPGILLGLFGIYLIFTEIE